MAINAPVLHLTRLAFIYGCLFVPRVLPWCISPAWPSVTDACLYQGCSRAASHLLYGEGYQFGIRLALIPLADRSEHTQRPFGVFRIPARKKYSLVSLDTLRCCDMSSNTCGRLGRGHFCGSRESPTGSRCRGWHPRGQTIAPGTACQGCGVASRTGCLGKEEDRERDIWKGKKRQGRREGEEERGRGETGWKWRGERGEMGDGGGDLCHRGRVCV